MRITTPPLPAFVGLFLLAGVVASACSTDPSPRQSFEICGRTLTVVDGATAYDWGDRYGNTDGHTIYHVVPTGTMSAPASIDEAVTGIDQFSVETSDTTRDISLRLASDGTGCFALTDLVVGTDVSQSYPSAEYPWVLSISE